MEGLKKREEDEEEESSLDQDPRIRIILHYCLAGILSVGISTLIFFSTWNYTVT